MTWPTVPMGLFRCPINGVRSVILRLAVCRGEILTSGNCVPLIAVALGGKQNGKRKKKERKNAKTRNPRQPHCCCRNPRR